MGYLNTNFSLRSGPPDERLVRELIALVLDFKWVVPSKHGGLVPEIPTPTADAVGAIVAHWREHGSVTINGRGGQILFSPNRKGESSATGFVCWFASEHAAKKPEWRRRHAEQSARIAKLLDTPLASAMLERDDRQSRSVPHRGFCESVPRVRGYHEGILAVFWRNFFGPPFTKLFGDRLARLPTNVARDLGDGYWLVQPYEMPDEAFTDEGRRREAETIATLGPEHFYDMTHEQLPKKRPVIP